ncbi:IclR family transcriptional regulator [Roseibium aggregatum]|uniref:IclR family transcriptional regulator n=1 Tax=Roseibium aggregatum TaxID=187304 RepID=A0A939EH97_9HYPH|nr:IclR family transcriptional regulator [Roseibium aggregatum]MBN9672994.1 IclR family transcriptional regulator [Roseibium aggregatum]
MADQSSTTVQKAPQKPVRAVLQTLKILRELGQTGEPMGATALARKAGLNTSTTFNILRTLNDEGMVSFDEATKTYTPALGLLGLVRSLVSLQESELLRRELVQIATQEQCLMALWQVVDDRVVLIDRALADTPVRLDMQVTQRMPKYLGAIGRVIAAKSDVGTEELRRWFSSMRWNSPISFAQYLDEVDQARVRGYAIDDETLYAGISVVASVITDAQNWPTFGISAIMLANAPEKNRLHEIGTRLAEIAKVVSDG